MVLNGLGHGRGKRLDTTGSIACQVSGRAATQLANACHPGCRKHYRHLRHHEDHHHNGEDDSPCGLVSDSVLTIRSGSTALVRYDGFKRHDPV
jgi:hypothetical protein